MNRQGVVVVENQRVDFTVLLASENRKSLMLELAEPVRVAGGVYFNSMPLLMDETGQYRDLVSGRYITLEWEP
jgi:hypothetical protein